MKLYLNSMSALIADYLCRLGNLPYSFLKLLPYPYESLKDAVQKLIRAEFVGIVKAKHLKSLYLTAKGTEALNECRIRAGDGIIKRHPVVYYPQKADRAGKLHITDLLFELAVPEQKCFQNSRIIKSMLESRNIRSSDNLKYSRFAGIWKVPEAGWLVYHFGHKNIHFNESGEFNARLLTEQMTTGYTQTGKVPVLILGDSMDTLFSILRYSEWYNSKSRGQQKQLKNTNFHFDFEWNNYANDIYFLPVQKEVIAILRKFYQGGFEERLQKLHAEYLYRDAELISLLHCKPWELFSKHCRIDYVASSNLVVLCYDWQQKMTAEYLSDATEKRTIWIQAITTDTVVDWINGKPVKLPDKLQKLQPNSWKGGEQYI